MNSEQTKVVMDEIIEVVERLASDFDRRIAVLEQSAGGHILDAIDFDRKDYRHNTLARHAGGLWQFSADDGWRCVVNNIAGVEFGEADGVMTLTFTKSDGARIERQLPYARQRREAA